jgi:hypothetical protein
MRKQPRLISGGISRSSGPKLGGQVDFIISPIRSYTFIPNLSTLLKTSETHYAGGNPSFATSFAVIWYPKSIHYLVNMLAVLFANAVVVDKRVRHEEMLVADWETLHVAHFRPDVASFTFFFPSPRHARVMAHHAEPAG